MNILLTGAYCAGKTTLANSLHAILNDSALIEDVTREVLALYGKVDWSIPELRDYILIRHLIEEKKAALSNPNHIIIDAGIVSFIAHDRILLKSPPDRLHLLDYFKHINYDAVFFCDHRGIRLQDDGERYTDGSLREQLASAIEETLSYLKIRDYIVLTGPPAERLGRAIQVVK